MSMWHPPAGSPTYTDRTPTDDLRLREPPPSPTVDDLRLFVSQPQPEQSTRSLEMWPAEAQARLTTLERRVLIVAVWLTIDMAALVMIIDKVMRGDKDAVYGIGGGALALNVIMLIAFFAARERHPERG